MPMPLGIWLTCAGILNDGEHAHMMRDSCWSCAPFWSRYAVCPDCGEKARKHGKQKCKGCGNFFVVVKETEEEKKLALAAEKIRHEEQRAACAG